VTHSGYLRALAAGRLDDVLQVGTGAKTKDLAEWRRAHGLAPQPAIVIASASLEFPLPASPARHGQRVILATGAATPAEKLKPFEAQGCEVIRAGAGAGVEGAPLTRALGELGFRSAYLLTGPRMLETMLHDGRLGRLYLTLAHRLLGGTAFETMIAGPELGDAGRLRLHSLHYDAGAPDGTGQWFAAFEPK
jgi:riboflavin biosynthesis pyrimidine reductase